MVGKFESCTSTIVNRTMNYVKSYYSLSDYCVSYYISLKRFSLDVRVRTRLNISKISKVDFINIFITYTNFHTNKQVYIHIHHTCTYNYVYIYIYIWERIWEKGPIGNVFTNLIAEKLPFQMLQTILKYS